MFAVSTDVDAPQEDISQSMMPLLKRESLQDDLAAILFKHVYGSRPTPDVVANVERLCKRIFLSCHSSRVYKPPPALLEALLVLSERNPSYSAEFLSCIIMLALCSARAWNLVSTASLFHTNPNARDLLGKVGAASNPCWDAWPQAEQEKFSSAFMTLSDLDMYAREGRVTALTPVSVALGEYEASSLPSMHRTHESGLKSELRLLVHHIPQKLWGSIPYGKLPFVLRVAVEAKVPEDCFLPHLSNSIMSRSPVIRECLFSLELDDCPLAKDLFSRIIKKLNMAYSVKSPSELIKDALNQINPVSEWEAYSLGRASSDDESSQIVLGAARRWMEQNHTNLVYAAYLAAPKLLNRIAESSESACSGIERLPACMYSPVDQTVDQALTGMLRCIPEIAETFSDDYVDDQDGYSALKKAVLIYPSIALRRTKCLCAAGQAVLAGLSDPSERYSTYCLDVIEKLLSVLSSLPGSPKPEVEEFCVLAFDFVLEEKRLEHGIPEFLSTLAISIMKLLCHCELNQQTTRLLEILDVVITREGSTETVMETACHLRRQILSKRSTKMRYGSS